MQFRIGSSYRFILWDNNSNGLFGAGYQNSAGHTNDSKVGENYDATSGTFTFNWTIIVKDGKAYWYINDVLVVTFDEPSEDHFKELNIGALQMNVDVYDIVIYAESGSADYYNAIVSKYN